MNTATCQKFTRLHFSKSEGAPAARTGRILPTQLSIKQISRGTLNALAVISIQK
jgi:hypothetical protein